MEIVLDEEQKEKVKVYNSLMSQIISWSSFDKNDANAGTRFINGGTGECAIVEHLGEKWSPYTFGGSFLNNYPDLLPYNLNLGVKTARINTRHIVRYSDTTSEILCGITNQKSIVPIGILTPEMTRLYGTTDGLNGDLKYTNKEKVCFSKYDVLKPIQWDKLKAEYSTGIIVKFENENITDEILKDAVYFEQINDEYITY